MTTFRVRLAAAWPNAGGGCPGAPPPAPRPRQPLPERHALRAGRTALGRTSAVRGILCRLGVRFVLSPVSCLRRGGFVSFFQRCTIRRAVGTPLFSFISRMAAAAARGAMRAVRVFEFGGPEVLRLQADVPIPSPEDAQVGELSPSSPVSTDTRGAAPPRPAQALLSARSHAQDAAVGCCVGSCAVTFATRCTKRIPWQDWS